MIDEIMFCVFLVIVGVVIGVVGIVIPYIVYSEKSSSKQCAIFKEYEALLQKYNEIEAKKNALYNEVLNLEFDYYPMRDRLKELEEEFSIISKENNGLHQHVSKLKTENNALIEKALLFGAKNVADDDYINYLMRLLDESNITYKDRHPSQRLLGDESNE